MDSLFFHLNVTNFVFKFVNGRCLKNYFCTGGWCSKLTLFSFHYCRIANITLFPHSQ